MTVFLLFALVVFMVLGLNGISSSFSRFRKTIERCVSRSSQKTEPEAIGKSGSLLSFPPLAAHFSLVLSPLTQPTWISLIALMALAGGAIAAGSIVLFIDLPVFFIIVLSMFSVGGFLVSALAISRRKSSNTWLPTSDSVSAPPDDSTTPPGSGISEKKPPETASLENPVCGPVEIPEDRKPAMLDMYWVVEPFSYVKIERAGTQGFTYTVVEPSISPKEKTILRETYAHLREIIIYDSPEESGRDHLTLERIQPIIRQFHAEIPDDRLAILIYYLRRDLSGYGPLEVLMRDPGLEDLSCNGNNLPVFVFHRLYGSLPSSVVFTEGELNQFVLKLAQKANKQLSLSNPMVDATLPDGARVQITYSEVVSTKGSSFTVRKFRAEPMTPLDLIRMGTYNAETLAFLWLAIENRKSLLVVGGTASGKTSTMNAVSLFIPQNAKIVSLEDTREIQLPHRNWLPTQTRELNVEGIKGDIDLFSLLKACMRQRPEFIIVGEVRGREAQTLFQAMNTGHATLSTIHAGSVHEAINRLTHDPINVPPVMFTALDLIVVQSIYTTGMNRIRRCLSIHEIEVNAQGEIVPVLLYEWEFRNDTFRKMTDHSRVLDEIAFHNGWDGEELKRQLKMREEFFSWALEVEPPDIRDLANAIHDLGK